MKINFDGVMATGKSQTDYKSSADKELLSPADKMARKERAENLTLLEIAKAYNKNKLIAGRTPEYLLKGIKEGKTVEELLLIAVKGVASCLGDPMLEKQVIKGLEERKLQGN